MQKYRVIILVLLVVAIVVAIGLLEKSRVGSGGEERGGLIQRMNDMNAKEKSVKYPAARELAGIAGYINSEPFKLEDQIGKKVILLDIWTYSCINCQRTLPYLNSWQEKYAEAGLLIVGVHTPEFEFEKKLENVQRAVEQYGINYPVVLDNDYATWHSYNNRYWPRKFLIDIDGYVVYDHIGEGGYQETERKIQELLAERADRLGIEADVAMEVSNFDTGAPTAGGNSPEIYFGASRNSYLGNGKDGKVGEQVFTEPEGLKTHILYLAGRWQFASEYAENLEAGTKIIYRYVGQRVFFVAQADKPTKALILRDGEPIAKELAGADIQYDAQGDSYIEVSESRLYKLIEQGAQEEHTLEIIPQTPGLQAFTFTFG
ncbi:MAG: thiol-disulfide isomerase [Candidatus Harrisonbacteria bacterium CG10_big_fil_rev_8_21_14_0_10_49_15]|uniref:Thiol-disulfide isomerase n=1 Tax=Candidatus Harrisonbacteria bacterium CG10_big_fil_rev_8_21_14_0_10_49_15 TaxID=1974587 RepID=A0A2H0UNS0_9BACT|nr:MAG: thiol-disulfide isomerase [Candidatus Harrisonbacteria bacterium CG10_big_fil_rev_8_21_14_0_10_49_15]